MVTGERINVASCNPRQIWYDVNGFQDWVKLRGDAGLNGYLQLMLIFPVLHTITKSVTRSLMKCEIIQLSETR
jgi:hypothetical protein